MADSEQDRKDGPPSGARESDDPKEAAEKVVEAGHDTSGGDSDSEATGTGASGGGEPSVGTEGGPPPSRPTPQP